MAKREGYKIYVRVPDGYETSEDDVREFLEHLAQLLTDESKHVSVDPYVEEDEEVDDAKPRGGSGAGAGGKAHLRSAGGHTSPLYPMYVCHGKF